MMDSHNHSIRHEHVRATGGDLTGMQNARSADTSEDTPKKSGALATLENRRIAVSHNTFGREILEQADCILSVFDQHHTEVFFRCVFFFSTI